MNISCIIVNYNNSAYLERAVMSVLEQTLPPDEIIIADDASTDSSVEIINRLSAMYACIKPILRQENIGVAANRDLAIKVAKGRFFTTLDSDDWFYPKKVEKEYVALGESLCSIACSDIDLVQNEAVFDTIETGQFCALQGAAERLHFLIARKKGMPRDMLMSKNLYLDVGGMKHELRRYEDWDLKMRLAEKEIVWVHSGVVGVAYRREGTGLSSASQPQHIIDQMRVLFSNFMHSGRRLSYLHGISDLILTKGARRILQREKSKK